MQENRATAGQEFGPVLTRADAARMLSVTPQTIITWELTRPDFPRPSRPTTRTVRYNRDKLLAWLESHETGAGE